ncbi:3-deoxy-7-phosphoheptulonate synthase [Streptomyces sp. SM13]|uniref:3-deoxy-7-phosphoheptulonate synthase n=1 Tax=Streptomyces sp. SM13 TaxID=1983803 RepID=UPI00215602F1|nr:3-deoxy-7-phosphoheptulonate synthase [Streptomyces sp. SM13]
MNRTAMSRTAETRHDEQSVGPLQPLTEDELDGWLRLPACQQPAWENSERARECRRRLQTLPGLVSSAEVERLRHLLVQCATGALTVIQVGHCAEQPLESHPGAVRRMAGLIDALAGTWQFITGAPAVRVGRMAGQYAKPRSAPTESVDGSELDVFRGHMVNRPGPDAQERRHLPEHMLHCYHSAERVMTELRRMEGPPHYRPAVWTSHEALILDYELALLRRDRAGATLLTSTHWPWIGERTRQLDGAHVQLLASVSNPVACKIGPTATPEDIGGLCRALNPDNVPGRLTLISRMGADVVGDLLPPLVKVATDLRCPVLWMCDPMHANTRRHNGVKTRFVCDVRTELRLFYECVAAAGAIPAGVHLEATPSDVAECVSEGCEVQGDAHHYTTLCDPRLNPGQALDVVQSAARTVADRTHE